MPSSLDEIVENKRREVAALKTQSNAPAAGLKARQSGLAENVFLKALRDGQTNLICEVKPKSPSAGNLRSASDWKTMVDAYKKHAAALSILTDEKYFGGSLALYRQIKSYVHLPMLRKDFLVDPIQCHESADCNADAALLIVKILTDEELSSLHTLLLQYGIAPVVEVQNDLELERAMRIAPDILLINNRDLSSFKIDLKTTERLCSKIPPNVKVISASGIETPSDLEQLLPHCNNFLIGSALMKSADPAGLLKSLAAVGTRSGQ